MAWRKKIYIFSLSFLLCLSIGSLHAQVSVNLKQPPMNQLRIADLWNLTITNSSNNNYRIYLQGSASETKDGLIAEAKTSAFDLKAHETKAFTPNNIGSADISWKNNKYKEIIIRTGAAPTGNYTICVLVKQETTDEELGRDCKEQVVEIISAPVLISPNDEASIDERNPTFSWLPPPGVPSSTAYKLKIVEVFGQQSTAEALSKNIPFFIMTDIKTAMLIYPVSGKNFEPGKKYAWNVGIVGCEGSTNCESDGRTFIFKELKPGTMLTREEAIDIIIKKIIVPASLDHRVSAFLGMQTTPSGTNVWPFMSEEEKRTINSPVWFGWVNDWPQAFFEHDTRYVYIDAYTGNYEVVTHGWWPVIDGESQWMSDEEKKNPAVLIYSDVNLR